MKLKIKETIEKEVELTFPTYRKSVAHHVKLISEKESIVITRGHNDEYFGIDYRNYLPAEWVSETECSEQEFNDSMNMVLSYFGYNLPTTLCEEIKQNAKENPVTGL